jgi:hypothetical protein
MAQILEPCCRNTGPLKIIRLLGRDASEQRGVTLHAFDDGPSRSARRRSSDIWLRAPAPLQICRLTSR